MKHKLIVLLIFLIFIGFDTGIANAQKVKVIAPSVSTSMESRKVLKRLKWAETSNYHDADGILVVVRSMLIYPLQSYYDSVRELETDAEGQLNITGSNFHIYVYNFKNDLSLTELEHVHYKARE